MKSVGKKLVRGKYFVAGALFVLVFNAFYIWRYAVPTIMHDEFGYWMSAAYFNGKCMCHMNLIWNFLLFLWNGYNSWNIYEDFF